MSIYALEQQLKNALDHVERGKMALKLSENKLFKTVILDQFCVEECARYAQASADPSLNHEQRADALALAQSAGHLKRYLSMCIQMGKMHEPKIAEIEEAIEEIRAEEKGE